MICSARGCVNSGGWISALVFLIVLITLSVARKSLATSGKRGAPPSFYHAGVLLYSRRLFLVRWARSLKAGSLLQQAVSTGICTHYKRRTGEKYLPGDQIFLHSLPQKSG